MLATRNIPLHHRFINARAARDNVNMMELGRSLLNKSADDPAVAIALARHFTETGLDDESLPYWRTLRRLDPEHLEAGYNLSRIDPDHAFRLGISKEEQKALLSLRDCSRPIPDFTQHTHIAICGISYCGSTLLEKILGSLPGMASIGESHVLTTHRDVHGRSKPFRLSDNLARLSLNDCLECGGECQFISYADRKALSADRRRWYARIAEMLHASVIVSSDKNMLKLLDNDPLLRMHGLVLFKSPHNAWQSWLKHQMPPGRDDRFYLKQFELFLERWTRAYAGFLDVFDPVGQKLFISFEAFTRRPEQILAALCTKLSIPFDAQALHKAQPSHAMGGNSAAVQRIRNDNCRINITEMLDAKTTPAQQALVDAHSELRRVYDRMMVLSENGE